MNWLGNDIQAAGQVFRHGDNGSQEFYELAAAEGRIGVFRNHPEKFWAAYCDFAGGGFFVLNTATRRHDGLDEGPLYKTKNEPSALCLALIEWKATLKWRNGSLEDADELLGN